MAELEVKRENRFSTRKNASAKPKYSEQTKTVAFRCPLSKLDELKIIVKSKINYLTGQSPSCPFFFTKTNTMIPEHRYSAIRQAFYEIAIYCLVQNQNTLLGLQRLKHMKEIIDKVEVSNDLDDVNYNHRFFKNVLESAIIETEAFIKKISES